MQLNDKRKMFNGDKKIPYYKLIDLGPPIAKLEVVRSSLLFSLEQHFVQIETIVASQMKIRDSFCF